MSVSREQVAVVALRLGFQIKREGVNRLAGMWWGRRAGGDWTSLGVKNALAVETMEQLAEEMPRQPAQRET